MKPFNRGALMREEKSSIEGPKPCKCGRKQQEQHDGDDDDDDATEEIIYRHKKRYLNMVGVVRRINQTIVFFFRPVSCYFV